MGASQPLRAAVARGPPSVALPTAAVRAQDVSLDDDGNGGGGGGGEVGGRNGGSGGGSTVAGAVVSELSSGSVAATAPSPYPQFTSIKDALRPVGGLPPPASASALNEEDCQGLLQGRRSGHREACGNGATDHASDEQAAHGSSHVTQTAYAELECAEAEDESDGEGSITVAEEIEEAFNTLATEMGEALDAALTVPQMTCAAPRQQQRGSRFDRRADAAISIAGGHRGDRSTDGRADGGYSHPDLRGEELPPMRQQHSHDHRRATGGGR